MHCLTFNRLGKHSVIYTHLQDDFAAFSLLSKEFARFKGSEKNVRNVFYHQCNPPSLWLTSGAKL